MLQYNINPATRGVNGFGLTPSDLVYRVLFDGTAEATVTVPGSLPMGALGAIASPNPSSIPANNPNSHNQYIAVFSYGIEIIGDVWVSNNATAAAPSTNNFVAGAAELFPKAWNVKSGDVIHAICGEAGQAMSVAFYNIQE